MSIFRTGRIVVESVLIQCSADQLNNSNREMAEAWSAHFDICYFFTLAAQFHERRTHFGRLPSASCMRRAMAHARLVSSTAAAVQLVSTRTQSMDRVSSAVIALCVRWLAHVMWCHLASKRTSIVVSVLSIRINRIAGCWCCLVVRVDRFVEKRRPYWLLSA